MLRLTRKREGEGKVTVLVEGRIVEAWAPLLERESEALLAMFRTVRLDLLGVTYMDSVGREALRRLLSQRVEIAHCSPLILQLLEWEGRP